jgi:hypothetical protein
MLNKNVRESNAETVTRIERQNYIVSAAIQTEMIVENACAIFAGLTMYIFFLFFFLFCCIWGII